MSVDFEIQSRVKKGQTLGSGKDGNNKKEDTLGITKGGSSHIVEIDLYDD